MQQIVFIDRDGVINIDPIGDYVKSWKEFRFEKDALESLKRIQALGFEMIIVSNQAGIGEGIYSELALWDIHEKMLGEFEKKGIRIRATYYCLHGKQAGCACRKPEIGLFKKAVEGITYDPRRTFFIGDKATDVEAGKRFGIRTLFVRTGHGKKDEAKLTGALWPDYIVDRFLDAVAILKQSLHED